MRHRFFTKQTVEERSDTEVSNGLCLGVASGCCFLCKEDRYINGQGQLGDGRWVFPSHSFDTSLDGEGIDVVGTVDGAFEASQFKGLADGR